MIGVYNGSDHDKASGHIQDAYQTYCIRNGINFVLTPFTGRSDYGPFIQNGVCPAGGLFSGAEEIKSSEEFGLFGGLQGVPYDPCYEIQYCWSYISQFSFSF